MEKSQNYLILLPNSEGKKEGGDVDLAYRFVSNLKKYNHFIKLQPQRDLIVDEIKRVIRDSSQEELSKLFDLKGNNLKDAITTMTALKDEECMSAIGRMDGVMYNAIDYEDLSEEKKKRFDLSTIIIDGLFGLLKPQDMVPNYKCKVSTKLFGATLAAYWRKELSGFFSYVCKDKLVIDILPQSHRDIIKDEELNRVEIIFATIDTKGKVKQEGHMSKKLKGEFVHYVLGFDMITKEDLKKFTHSQGHKYSEEHSSEELFIYVKE